MTTPHKLLIVQAQNRVVRIQEFRVEDDLDTVRRAVKQLHAADLVQDRVARVVGHVVGDDGRERVALERKDAALEENLVFLGEQGLGIGDLGAVFAVPSVFGAKRRVNRIRPLEEGKKTRILR